jgi:hypothetical protein
VSFDPKICRVDLPEICVTKGILTLEQARMLLVLTVIQRMVVLVQLPLYRKQILPSPYRAVCASRYSRQRSHNFLKQSAVLFARI